VGLILGEQTVCLSFGRGGGLRRSLIAFIVTASVKMNRNARGVPIRTRPFLSLEALIGVSVIQEPLGAAKGGRNRVFSEVFSSCVGTSLLRHGRCFSLISLRVCPIRGVSLLCDTETRIDPFGGTAD
jgi:hypothetical protein